MVPSNTLCPTANVAILTLPAEEDCVEMSDEDKSPITHPAFFSPLCYLMTRRMPEVSMEKGSVITRVTGMIRLDRILSCS